MSHILQVFWVKEERQRSGIYKKKENWGLSMAKYGVLTSQLGNPREHLKFYF